MKRIIVLIFVMALLFPRVLPGAIGAGSLTQEAKQGWAWFLNAPNNWTDLEPKLIIWLETQGQEYNLQRLEANAARKAKVDQIKNALRAATDAQINAALAALGL